MNACLEQNRNRHAKFLQTSDGIHKLRRDRNFDLSYRKDLY